VADRPLATLLSQWGEGYCSACQFVVGLTREGRLAEHTRGRHAVGMDYHNTVKPCKGSGRKPPKVTPHMSRKAAFRLSAPDVWCPECKQSMTSVRQGGVQVYPRHSYPRTEAYFRPPKMCPNTYLQPGRDHSRERG
jgi:hypothetical protein